MNRGGENILRDVGYALRTFRRAPLASLTIVMTVAIGLGLITMLFSILNMMLFRVDNVPDINEMFGVERPRGENDERRLLTRPQFDALTRETVVFSGTYAELPDLDLRVDGRMMSGTLVSGNAFQVLGVHAMLGRTLLPSDDQRGAGQPVIVLSHRGWTRRFGSDPQVVGRKVLVNGAPHEVIGVMPESFRGLAVSAPSYWAPLSMMAEHRPIHRGREDRIGLNIVGRLRPGVSAASARAQLEAWDAGQPANTSSERRTADIVLLPRRGIMPQPIEALIVFTPLFFSFGLILMIGCANVANLLLARGMSRQKEIGVRLSLGASRARIIRQLLTESLLLALAASAVGFWISRAALDATIAAVMRSMPVDAGDITLMLPGADWRVGLFLVFGAIVATGFFGLMPALQATRIDPVRTMRGELVKEVRPRRSRNILIGLQVGASTLLLICSAVFLRSSLASATVDPGFRTEDTVLIDIINEPKREAMLQAIRSEPAVVAASVVSPDMTTWPRAAFAESPAGKFATAYRWVSPEYLGVLDIPILSGRGFSDVEGAGKAPVVIVSHTLAGTLWPNADAIGQTLLLEADPNSPTRRVDEQPLPARTFTVVGVSRDVPGIRMADIKEAALYVPTSLAMPKSSVVARVQGDPDLVRQQLLDRLTLVDPNMGQILTMRTMARLEGYFLGIAFWFTLVLGVLALTLTVSGLFSVLSYLVEQRAREIGVRIALGATSKNVTRLVIAQTSRPVIAGLMAGTALAVALATVLLSMPAAGAIGEVIHVLDPIAYAVSLMFIIAACLLAATIPAARASRLDPMQTLRQD